MKTRIAVLLGSFFLAACVASGQSKPTFHQGDNQHDRVPFSPLYIPSGEHMFNQFCAACHGADAKGHGPASYSLKVPAPDLTTLATRHGGKFPSDYVSAVLLFGPGTTAHGAADMPTWGPLFLFLDKHDEAAARQRIKNLSEYLESLQNH